MYRGRNVAVHQQTVTSTAAVVGLTGKTVTVVLQNDPDSAADMAVGNATNQYFILEPGKSLSLTIEECTKLYVKSAGANITLNVLALS